jgi:hypothetical protein
MCAHGPQRLGDPLHRTRAQRRVADERELAVLPGQDPGDQAKERARVAAVDRLAGRAEASEPDPVHAQPVGLVLVDPHSERAHCMDGRLRVAGASEVRDRRLAVGDRAE